MQNKCDGFVLLVLFIADYLAFNQKELGVKLRSDKRKLIHVGQVLEISKEVKVDLATVIEILED